MLVLKSRKKLEERSFISALEEKPTLARKQGYGNRSFHTALTIERIQGGPDGLHGLDTHSWPRAIQFPDTVPAIRRQSLPSTYWDQNQSFIHFRATFA